MITDAPELAKLIGVLDDLGRRVRQLETAQWGGKFSGCRVYAGNQDIANMVATCLAYPNERYDTDDFHDNAVNNSRLTCQATGYHLILGQANWSPAAGGRRWSGILLNGGTVLGQVRNAGAGNATWGPIVQVVAVYHLDAGD